MPPKDYSAIDMASRSLLRKPLLVGDAAGMVRPFKGKSVNSGFLTGIRAANTIMKVGISQKAFEAYYRSCRDVTYDFIVSGI